MPAKLANEAERRIISRWIKHPELEVNLDYYLNDAEARVLYIRDYDNKPIGVVFFGRKGAEIAISVAPDLIGKRRGRELLAHGVEWISRFYPNHDYIWGNCVNDASRKLFKAFGFEHEAGDFWLRLKNSN